MTSQQLIADCWKILPEIALTITICVVILMDVIIPKNKPSRTGLVSLFGLALALLPIGWNYGISSVFALPSVDQVVYSSGATLGPEYGFSRMYVNDKLSDFFKVLFYFSSMGVVLFTIRSTEIEDKRRGEYYSLLLTTVVSASFLASSNNFLMLVLALETLSLCSYALVGYRKEDRLSSEASLKYILYGSVASGVMLFGISYLYGMAGTLDISRALQSMAMRETSALAVMLAFVLVIAGIGFKIAAVPFHFWAPDVYQGAPTPITAFLSVVSKAAGFSALFRVLLPLFALSGTSQVMPDSVLAVKGALTSVVEQGHLALLFWILSALTMTVGNMIAIRQNNVKRLLAYSSIAHAGFILMGMTVFTNESLEAMLFYLLAYALTNLGIFLIVILLIEKTGSADIRAYKGMFWKSPALFIALFIFLISLTGIPPTAGFLGKMMVFKVVAGAASQAFQAGANGEAWMYASLAIIGAVNTGIALYYYMRIVKIMVFEKPDDETPFVLPLLDRLCILMYLVPVTLIIFPLDYAIMMTDLSSLPPESAIHEHRH